jgi:H+-translocating NAD(P) transhydrogenase subunit alpha
MRTRIAVWLILALLTGPTLLASAQTTPAVPAAGPTAGASPITLPAAPEAKQIAAAAHAAEGPQFDLMSMLFVFMLATFIGIQVIGRVSRLLHTPLMSLTNAISAIAVVGAIIVTGAKHPPFITILGAVALFASMTNIVSGFLITDRMLKMFKTREAGK